MKTCARTTVRPQHDTRRTLTNGKIWKTARDAGDISAEEYGNQELRIAEHPIGDFGLRIEKAVMGDG